MTRKYDMSDAAANRIERRLILDEDGSPRFSPSWHDLVRATVPENPHDRSSFAIAWLQWTQGEDANGEPRASAQLGARIAIERARKANELESRTRGFARALDRLFDEADAHPYAPNVDDVPAWREDDTPAR